jgi:oligoribonuclease NrnB/cAMP/cGMP phosphodiesterase (DHH superfamily)
MAIQIFDIIIYHTQCSDGIVCAWIAKKTQTKSKYISYKAGCVPRCEFSDKNILFMDISPNFDQLLGYICNNKKIVIIDHHKSALDNIKQLGDKPENLELHIDMNKAGCQLAWEYFFHDKPIPWFIDYIADRDLWTWKLENSKNINTALFYDGEISIGKLDELLVNSEEKIKLLIERGKIINDIRDKEIRKYQKEAIEAELCTPSFKYKCWLSNCPYNLRSDVGSALANTQFPNGDIPAFSASWLYNPQTNEWYVSLRGSKYSPDLSEICKFFGGGGHPKASGFTIPLGKTLRDIFTIS